MKKLSLFAVMVLVAAPCLAQKVNVDFDDQADFSKYRSYDYQPEPASKCVTGSCTRSICSPANSGISRSTRR